MKTLTITQPDDWHCHLRDGALLKTTVLLMLQRFARAIVMPNLNPPVVRLSDAKAYRERILAVVPKEMTFQPLMTLYLTDHTTPQWIQEASESSIVFAAKLYPAGATTNSEEGVTSLEKIYPVLEEMMKRKMPLLVHGEVTDPSVDVFDREKYFIERQLIPITQKFPDLKIVFEHITTKEAVDFVLSASDRVAATITAHHLLLNRNELLVGGIKPHHYCLPILKRKIHQDALIKAATSGNKKFFLGTDSAPHAKNQKENSCGCAGIFTAHAGIELYAEVFEQANVLEKLEAFASFYGADFYGLPRNQTKITLEKRTWTVPASYPFGEHSLIPFRANETVSWLIGISE
ncbi:MAG: dihydroorotase [Proteobacteria bacterium]|nr:dihydroorotase [Pseudomonadota bacterium]